jgi:hypothetical protein
MFRVDLEYRIGGRRVSQDEWMKSIVDEARGAALSQVQAKVESLRCPDHGRGPRLTAQVPAGTDVNLSFDVCCEKLKDAIMRLLR